MQSQPHQPRSNQKKSVAQEQGLTALLFFYPNKNLAGEDLQGFCFCTLLMTEIVSTRVASLLERNTPCCQPRCKLLWVR